MSTEAMLRELEELVAEVKADKSTSEWDDSLHETSLQCFDFLLANGSALAEVVRDAEKWRSLRDDKSVSITISKNDHANVYMSSAQWIDENADAFSNTPQEALDAMRKSGDIWQIQWYPDTPIGFYAVHRATLDEAIDAARGIG